MALDLDTNAIKSVIATAEEGHFTRAANRVGKSQSALSLQIKKLETDLGVSLFDRTQKQVRLTPEGEVFLGYAQRILSLYREVISRLKEPDVDGEIRLGTPEDFATHYLPKVLESFRKLHPRVKLSVGCDLTLNLVSGFERGDYDIVLVKRDPGGVTGGLRVWREPLVWAAAEGYDLEETLSLILSPQPCIYRARALAALDQAGRAWRISYSSQSLAGALAAVRAGLGVSVLPANMLPRGIVPLREATLPVLEDAEIALMQSDQLSKTGEILARHLVQSLEGGR